MPYSIEKRIGGYVVIKDEDGKIMGKHKSRKSAQNQIEAILANEEKSIYEVPSFKFRPTEDGVSMCGSCKEYKLGNCTLHDTLVSKYGLCDDFSTKSTSITDGTTEEKEVLPPNASIKSVGDGVYRGRGVIYGGKDLTGDVFTKSTDLGLDRHVKGMPVFYDHSLSGLKSNIGKVIDYTEDDDGITFEFELNRHHKYWSEVSRLIESGAAGLSTGTMKHTIIKDKNGNLKRWIVGELSITPVPAEPRTVGKVKSVKSFHIDRLSGLESSLDKIEKIVKSWRNE